MRQLVARLQAENMALRGGGGGGLGAPSAVSVAAAAADQDKWQVSSGLGDLRQSGESHSYGLANIQLFIFPLSLPLVLSVV